MTYVKRTPDTLLLVGIGCVLNAFLDCLTLKPKSYVCKKKWRYYEKTQKDWIGYTIISLSAAGTELLVLIANTYGLWTGYRHFFTPITGEILRDAIDTGIKEYTERHLMTNKRRQSGGIPRDK